MAGRGVFDGMRDLAVYIMKGLDIVYHRIDFLLKFLDVRRASWYYLCGMLSIDLNSVDGYPHLTG